MEPLYIIGISVSKREEVAIQVQAILTKHGDNIVARFGIHDIGEEKKGLITLNFMGGKQKAEELTEELCNINGVQASVLEIDCA